jgi:ATP-dependent RNA helicase DeaD
VRPGDLVGAITGETDAVGGQIGKIDIRDSYSLVDVETGIADHVIRELSGAAIRGRRVEVRRDRES